MEKPIKELGFDITKNIKTIEILKSRLLSEVAVLYEDMLSSHSDIDKRADLLSEILILTYILSNKLGITYEDIDKKIKNKLRLGVLEEKKTDNEELSSLLKHIDKKR